MERVFAETEVGERREKKKKESDGETFGPESERGRKRRAGSISLGGKVSGPVGVSSRVQSLCGWGRKTGREGIEGGLGTARVSSSMEYA